MARMEYLEQRAIWMQSKEERRELMEYIRRIARDEKEGKNGR